MKLAALLMCASWVLAAAPASAQQALVAAQSEIRFTSRQMGVPVEGRFKRFDAQIAFDPAQPAAAKIAMEVDLTSVSLGMAESEAELAKPEWFATRQFPKASFNSTAVTPVAPGRYVVAGKLAIKGRSRDIVVPVELTASGGRTSATGAFALKRLDFRIGDGDWKDTSLVADEVQVAFRLILTGVAAP